MAAGPPEAAAAAPAAAPGPAVMLELRDLRVQP